MAIFEAKADVAGSVWKIVTQVGQTLAPGDTLMFLESMKMEIPVVVEDGGTVLELRVSAGMPVTEGQVVAILETKRH